MSPAEQALLQRWTDNRDAEAFAELVRRYAGLVYGTCRRVLRDDHYAEDVAQDCFLKLAQAGTARIESLGGWLHRVATRESLNRVKSERRRTVRESAFVHAHLQDTEVAWDDLQGLVDEALDTLRDDLRAVLIRHFLQGETHDEIARTLEVSRSTITRRIAQGIEELRTRLRTRGVEVATVVLSVSMAAHMAEAAPTNLRAALGRYALAGAGQTKRSASVVRFPRRIGSPATLSSILAVAMAGVLLAGTWWLFPREPARPSTTATVGPALERREEAQPYAGVAETATPPDAGLAALANEPPTSEAAPAEAAPAEAQGNTERVSLRCVDLAGKPVPGAEVFFIHHESFADPMTYPASPSDRRMRSAGPVITGDDGWVRIKGVPRFSTQTGSRYAYARVPGALAGIWAAHSRPFPGVEATSDIPMVPAINVSGRVEVAAGTDATGVTVDVLGLNRHHASGAPTIFAFDYASTERLWPEIFQTTPDSTGTFAIPDMPQDATVYLSANGPGLANAQFMGSNLKGQTASLIMEPEGVVEGRVIRGSTDPVAGIPVLVQAEQARGILLPRITPTDASGSFRVAGLAPGRHNVRVLVGNQPSQYIVCPLLVEVVSGVSVRVPDLVLERGAMVSGTVRDAQAGTPIPGATLVALFPAEIGGTPVASGTAGMDGVYSMRLPVGEHMFYLFDATDGYEYPEDQAKRVVVVPAMQQSVLNVDFELTRKGAPTPTIETARIEGRVVDEAGSPVEGATVTDYMTRDRGPGFTTVAIGQSGADGGFSFEIRAGNEHEIGVGGGAHTNVRSETFIADAGESYDVGTFTVQALHGVFTGTVVDDSGAPLANAEVYVSSLEATWTSAHVITDRDGRFRIDPAPENDIMRVNIRKDGYGKGYYQDFSDVPSDDDRTYTLTREE